MIVQLQIYFSMPATHTKCASIFLDCKLCTSLDWCLLQSLFPPNWRSTSVYRYGARGAPAFTWLFNYLCVSFGAAAARDEWQRTTLIAINRVISAPINILHGVCCRVPRCWFSLQFLQIEGVKLHLHQRVADVWNCGNYMRVLNLFVRCSVKKAFIHSHAIKSDSVCRKVYIKLNVIICNL